MHAPDAATGPAGGLEPVTPRAPRVTASAGAPAGARSYEPARWPRTPRRPTSTSCSTTSSSPATRSTWPASPGGLPGSRAARCLADAAAKNPPLGGATHPTFIELGTNDGSYMHRYGSNIHNGAYYADKDYTNTISHYWRARAITLRGWRPPQQAQRHDQRRDCSHGRSHHSRPAARVHCPGTTRSARWTPDLFTGAVMTTPAVPDTEVQTLLSELGSKSYWTCPCPRSSAPQGRRPQHRLHGRGLPQQACGRCETPRPTGRQPPEIQALMSREAIVHGRLIRRAGPPDRLSPDPGGLMPVLCPPAA